MATKIFSIVTVVYNGATLLEDTIKSVLAQNTDHLEYIIVDGGSTDSTVDIIKRYDHHISAWVSEPDRGLYDAMNKGLTMATGDYIWFINAGDLVYQPSTIDLILAQTKDQVPDVIYGEVELMDKSQQSLGTRSALSTRKLPDSLTKDSFLLGMVVSHQAFIARRAIAPMYQLNNLSADIDWCLHILEESQLNVRINEPLARYLVGGISHQNQRQSWKDRYTIMTAHFGPWKTFTAHIHIVFRAIYHQLKNGFKKDVI